MTQPNTADRGDMPDEVAEAVAAAQGRPADDLDIEITLPGDEPLEKPPTSTDSVEELRARALAAEERAARFEKRYEDTHRQWNQDHMSALELRKELDALKQEGQRAALAAEQARVLAPPEWDDDDLADPEQAGKVLRAMRDWTQNTVAASLAHPAAQVETAVSQLSAVTNIAADLAWDKAREKAKAQGYDPVDLDAKRDEIEAGFEAMGRPGQTLRLDPKRILGAYALIKTEKEEPLTNVNAGGAPVTTRPNPARNEEKVRNDHARLAKIRAHYGTDLSRVLRRLGMEKLDNLEDHELLMLERGIR